MPKVKSIAEALKYISSQINETLLDEVSESIKDAEIRHAYRDVYSRPDSLLYERRYSDGGIGDYDNLEERLEGDGLLAVENVTPFNPYLNGRNASDGMSHNSGEGLDGLVEFGDGGWKGLTYDWAKGEPARPFIQNTIDELRTTKAHVKSLKDGLKKRGVNVK